MLAIALMFTATLPILTKAEEPLTPKEPPSKLTFNNEPVRFAQLKPEYDRQQAEIARIARIAQESQIKAEKEEEARLAEIDRQTRILASRTAQKRVYASTHQQGVTIVGNSNEQCIIFVQRIRGDRKAHGYAGNLIPEGQTPVVGAIVVFSRVGHVAIVIKIVEGGVIVRDANWIPGKITEHFVPFEDIAGFIY